MSVITLMTADASKDVMKAIVEGSRSGVSNPWTSKAIIIELRCQICNNELITLFLHRQCIYNIMQCKLIMHCSVVAQYIRFSVAMSVGLTVFIFATIVSYILEHKWPWLPFHRNPDEPDRRPIFKLREPTQL